MSDQYPNLFVPTGLTFSIWGVIYILLAIFVIYGLIVTARKDTEKSSFIGNIGILFFISCLANIGWIFAWHYEVVPLMSHRFVTGRGGVTADDGTVGGGIVGFNSAMIYGKLCRVKVNSC